MNQDQNTKQGSMKQSTSKGTLLCYTRKGTLLCNTDKVCYIILEMEYLLGNTSK